MLTYTDIATIMLARLDDQGSQRYLPLQDLIPAINSAISRMQSAFGWALANRKGSEEAMRDFTRIAIFQTDGNGAIALADPLLGHSIANVLAVYPLPLTQQAPNIIPAVGSTYRPDLTFAGPTTPCQRVTLEMAPMITNNASMRGNEVLAANASRRSWAYYLYEGSVNLLPRSQALTILAAIAHIEKFAPMTTTTSTVNVPEYTADLLASWALNYVAWKQDPSGQGVGAISSADAAALFQFNVN